MNEISTVGINEPISFLPANIEEEAITVEVLDDQQQVSTTGETEKRMIAEESLRCAISPNIREMQRIEEINAKLQSSLPKYEKFKLGLELFTILFQAYQKSGKDVSQFILLAKRDFEILKDEECKSLVVNSFGKDEQELIDCYKFLLYLAPDLSVETFLSHKFYLTPAKIGYGYYYLKIFQLEESLNCPILGILLVYYQAATLSRILCEKLEKLDSWWDESFTDEFVREKFYWENYTVALQECLDLEDKKGKMPKNEVLDRYFAILFDKCYIKHFPLDYREVNLVTLFFPFVVKYAKLEIVRGRFDEINKDLPAWDKAFNWVDLHLKAAELLLPTDKDKAKMYFDKAKQLTRDTLWCYPTSLNHSSWKSKHDEAIAKIESIAKMF